MKTSEKLRYYRKQADLTTKQLADKIGAKSGSYVSCYENERRIPGRKTLQKFADALGISVLELEDDSIIENAELTFSGNKSQTVPSAALSWVETESNYCCLSEEDKEIIRLAETYTEVFNQLQTEEKKQLVDFCTSLLTLDKNELGELFAFTQAYTANITSLSEKEKEIVAIILREN